MQTTYYTLTARTVLASGGETLPSPRRLVYVRSDRQTADAGMGKVIPFPEVSPVEPVFETRQDSGVIPSRSGQVPRGGLTRLLQAGELLATCAVIGVMALLVARLLAF